MFRKRECSLRGNKVVLVPYSSHHVQRYHEWMQDPILRTQTASEPLTLQQEHDMQQTWLWDDDKCTFIVLNKELYDEEHFSEVESMVGDVNMFLSKEEIEEASVVIAEIDIMIAESAFRGRGFGTEATSLMMMYGACELGIKRFRAKISMENKASLGLFKNRLKFKELSESDVFGEVTLELIMEQELVKDYQTQFKALKWTKYIPKNVPLKVTET